MENNNIGINFVSIPVEVLQDKELTPSEKILYAYLSIFRKGVCFQSNAKLEEITGIPERTIRSGLSKLESMKYVFIEFENGNSAKRKIYVIFDNPKKIEYLSRKGMFNLDRKPEVVRTSMSEPKPIAEPKKEEPEPIVDTISLKMRPRRADFTSDEEYEKSFYNWNRIVL